MKTPRRPTRFHEFAPALSSAAETATAVQGNEALYRSEMAKEPGPHQPPPLAPLDERIVQAIWNEQLIKADVLVTADGRPVRVFDPGKWNGEAGPDFRCADIAIGNQRCRGDIEIHLYASDWEKHGHQADFDYNNVILHVVLFNDDARASDSLHNGEYAPRLVLDEFLQPDLDTIRQSLAGEDYFYAPRTSDAGPGCQQELARLPEGRVCELLAEAARERMETRVQRYAAQATSTSFDQALYQAIMTSMGHRGGKTLFFLLARRAPLADLRLILRHLPPAELPAAIEAVLLRVAGLATHRAADCNPESLDPESAAYVTHIDKIWTQFERYFADRIIPPTRRWMTGVRPVNFPSRRIAGVARFLAIADFHGSLVDWLADVMRHSAARQPRTAKDFKKEIAALAELFTAGEFGYWATRYSIGGRPSKSSMALIGTDRALSVLFNAVLPIMLLHARHMGDDVLEKHLWRLHDNFPALQENTVTKFMRLRLFGQGILPRGVTFRLEAQNQALIHVYQECCSNEALTCENCVARRAARCAETAIVQRELSR